MPLTKIVVVEDHQVVREGLCALLEAEVDFEVIGEADNGLDAMTIVNRLRPDVLLLDLMLPGLNGLEVTRQIHQETPTTRILIMSMYADDAYVGEALESGASGYLLKTASSSEMIAAVRAVLSGRRYLSPPLADRGIEAYAQHTQHSRPTPDAYDTLTGRERAVLQLVAEGHKNAEAASRLCISVRTVEAHRASLMRKLNLQSKADLARYTLRRGLVPAE